MAPFLFVAHRKHFIDPSGRCKKGKKGEKKGPVGRLQLQKGRLGAAAMLCGGEGGERGRFALLKDPLSAAMGRRGRKEMRAMERPSAAGVIAGRAVRSRSGGKREKAVWSGVPKSSLSYPQARTSCAAQQTEKGKEEGRRVPSGERA